MKSAYPDKMMRAGDAVAKSIAENIAEKMPAACGERICGDCGWGDTVISPTTFATRHGRMPGWCCTDRTACKARRAARG